MGLLKCQQQCVLRLLCHKIGRVYYIHFVLKVIWHYHCIVTDKAGCFHAYSDAIRFGIDIYNVGCLGCEYFFASITFKAGEFIAVSILAG